MGGGSDSGLPYASLRSKKVNLRVGPGINFPIDWVIRYKHLPVCIIDSFQLWRRIKLYDGTIGWIHQNMLQQKETAVTLRPIFLMASPSLKASRVALLQKGVVVFPLKTSCDWIKVLVCSDNSFEAIGWVRFPDLWGGIKPRISEK
jgi:SH3-like domain-containing protein